jgi:hypothetical protein
MPLLVEDCAALQQALLRWRLLSLTARLIDRGLGDIQHDLVAGTPLMSYLRCNVDWTEKSILTLMLDLEQNRIQALSETNT